MRKPVLLWLADTPGWAYDAIVQHVAARLPSYEHRVRYVCGGPQAGASRDMQEADVIVAMYLLYLRLVPPPWRAKTTVMVTGFRPFERNA
jgi:hypothetical protein